MLGIKEFLKRFVHMRGVVLVLGCLKLCLKFLFGGNSVDSLCPGHDVMELKSFRTFIRSSSVLTLSLSVAFEEFL